MMLPAGALIVGAHRAAVLRRALRPAGLGRHRVVPARENLARYAEGVGAPNRGPLFYLPVVFADLYFPWSLLLPVALVLVPGARPREAGADERPGGRPGAVAPRSGSSSGCGSSSSSSSSRCRRGSRTSTCCRSWWPARHGRRGARRWLAGARGTRSTARHRAWRSGLAFVLLGGPPPGWPGAGGPARIAGVFPSGLSLSPAGLAALPRWCGARARRSRRSPGAWSRPIGSW